MDDFGALLKKAKDGDTEAQLTVAGAYASANKLEESKKWLELAAQSDNPQALYHLGFVYFKGLGCEKNPVTAAEYLKRSAEFDFADAQAQLGAFYFQGIGVVADSQMGLYWTRKACQQENPLGLYNLAVAYYEGIGMPKNKKKCLETLRRASKSGNKDADSMLNNIIKDDPDYEEEDAEYADQQDNVINDSGCDIETLNDDGNNHVKEKKPSFWAKVKKFFS